MTACEGLSCLSLTDWIGAFSAFAAAVSAVAGAFSARAAFAAITASRASRRNEMRLAHAIRTLERAYASITTGDGDRTISRNRVDWLTAARLILEYRSAKETITDHAMKRECESNEEHWRHQFYLALEPLAHCQPSFYAGETRNSRQTIEPVSAIIVHDFAMWPDGKADPLSQYDGVEDAIRRVGIHGMWLGLRLHLGQM